MCEKIRIFVRNLRVRTYKHYSVGHGNMHCADS